MRRFRVLMMLVVVALVALSCSGDDDGGGLTLGPGAQSDDGGGDGNGGGGGDGSGDGAGGDGAGGDGDGSGGDGGGVPNPLCPTSDTASPPAGFPFAKPPSMSALAYATPSQTLNTYQLRGVTFNPQAVISELMTVVFPAATFTQTSDVPGQEAFDFVDPLGVGEYFSITPENPLGDNCTSIQIDIEMGAAPPDADDAGAGAVAAEGSSEAGDGSGVEVTTEGGDAPPTGAQVSVVDLSGTYSPTPSVCIVNSTQVLIEASGDGELAVFGDANQVTIEFTNTDGIFDAFTGPMSGAATGVWQYIAGNGLIIEAEGCDS